MRPPFKLIFGDVFKRHKTSDSEEIFICGTEKTTPELGEDGKLWPKTWLWSRILIAFAVAFVLLYICMNTFENLNAYPGVMFIGAFAVPFSILVLFFELNTPKNISFFTMLKYFMVGGCASLLVTMILYEIFPIDNEGDYVQAVLVGCIEEIAKLAIVVGVVWMDKKSKYALNGLLIGAAIGAGFAAFESAGYAFVILLSTFDPDEMITNIFMRAILAPGGHVIWAAMSGYAIMLVKGDKQLSMSFLNKKAFWKIFWIPILLHAVWDMPIDFSSSDFGQVAPRMILTVIGWLVTFVMISTALEQVGVIYENNKKLASQPSEVTSQGDLSHEETAEAQTAQFEEIKQQ